MSLTSIVIMLFQEFGILLFSTENHILPFLHVSIESLPKSVAKLCLGKQMQGSQAVWKASGPLTINRSATVHIACLEESLGRRKITSPSKACYSLLNCFSKVTQIQSLLKP